MRAVARLAAAARASFAARTCAAAFASAAAAATAIARAITSRRRAVSGVTGFESDSACFVFVESARPEKHGSPPASASPTRLFGSVAGPSSSDVHDEGAVDTPVWLFALPKRAAAGATGAGAAAISRSPRGAPAASPRDGGMYVELPFSTRQISSGRADARGRARTREAFARASGYASRFQVRLALTLARRGACPRVHAVAPGAGDAILFNTLLTH
jgi:hypothetical protein